MIPKSRIQAVGFEEQMKLHFDPNQDCQLQAIKSIVGIFEGQPKRMTGRMPTGYYFCSDRRDDL